MLVVVRTIFPNGFIKRSYSIMFLGFFLKKALGIYPRTVLHYTIKKRANKIIDKCLCTRISAIKIYSSNNRLKGVGENVLPCPADIFCFSSGEKKEFIDAN